MSQFYVKIRQRGEGSKYRKMLSTDKIIYPESTELIQNSMAYSVRTLLDENEWYFIENFSQTEFSIDIINNRFESVDFDKLDIADFNKIAYIFVEDHDELFFQNITKSKLVKRKRIVHMGEDFKYDEGAKSIALNEIPDAVYVRTNDRLYFRKLVSVTGIFTGIDQLYREATESETENFLERSFITLKNDFSSNMVKTANRKRIALAEDILSGLHENEQEKIFSYIGDYCPNLKCADGSFEICNENDLKLLLFGIEQRFYTTPVGKEKRIANSVIKLG